MTTKITQQKLAKKLGLSRSTVAAALNPDSPTRLTEKTRKRVLQAAERWNYRPNRYARVMRGGKSGLIGMLHCGGLLQVAAERTFHATAEMRQAGFDVLSVDLSWNAGMIQPACLSLLDAHVEGVIVSGLSDESQAVALEDLHAAGIPIVALTGNPPPWIPIFRGDACQAYFELTRHLISLGHRRLGLLIPFVGSGPSLEELNWSSGERLKGFKMALEEAGGCVAVEFPKSEPPVPYGVVFFMEPPDPFDPFAPGYESMARILDSPVRPTAVLCNNDEIAHGAMSACWKHKLILPDEMAITGYDDIALSKISYPPLTSVRQPNQLMAEAAVRFLLERVGKGPVKESHLSQLFPCQVILRESSVPPRGKS